MLSPTLFAIDLVMLFHSLFWSKDSTSLDDKKQRTRTLRKIANGRIEMLYLQGIQTVELW